MTQFERITDTPNDLAVVIATSQKKIVSLFTNKYIPPTESDIQEVVDWLNSESQEKED